MSKHRASMVVGIAVLLLLGSGGLRSASGHQTTGRHHKTQNGAGCQVTHSHPAQCTNGFCANGGACPTNAVCESAFGFNAAHRKASWTSAFNCHGRTFDNRGSWTGTADIFISCDSGFCPLTPQIGDAIVWSGGGVHSVTIKGAWNGLSTLVRSKYGCCGEYEHALVNSTNTYGGNWAPIRLFNSPVFLTGGSTDDLGGVPLPADPAELETIAKSMPWYDTVLASAVEYAVEHPRRVWESGRVSDRTLAGLRATEDPVARLEILAEDLRDPRHYTVLAAYNHPADSADFVGGVEAGRVLAKMARDYPDELRDAVVRLLEETALGTQYDHGARAAAILFASRVLGPQERSDLQQMVTSTLSVEEPSGLDGQINLVDYYSQRYLQPFSE